MSSPQSTTANRLVSSPKVARRATLKQKLLLLAGSIAFCFLLLLLGEAFCRMFLDITVQGNSRELFAAHVFGDSMGHARNARGNSFGADVSIDGHGFRVPPGFVEKKRDSAILILGDSVGFGCGVEEPQTFAGLLRQERADMTVYNSSVIGYALPDYKNVVEHFVPEHPEIRKVYLSFCVNDVSKRSASQIESFLQGAGDSDAIGKLKVLPVISQVHGFLRSRSRLYVGVKNALTDPSRRYFENDLVLYQVDDREFNEKMQPVLEIDRELRDRGIDFTVVLAPCEPQLHAVKPEYDAWQKKLTEFFRAHGIRCIDPLDKFREYPGNRKKLYLSGDAMHFSAAGHRLYADVFLRDLER